MFCDFGAFQDEKHRIFCDFGALQERSIGYSEILENPGEERRGGMALIAAEGGWKKRSMIL